MYNIRNFRDIEKTFDVRNGLIHIPADARLVIHGTVEISSPIKFAGNVVIMGAKNQKSPEPATLRFVENGELRTSAMGKAVTITGVNIFSDTKNGIFRMSARNIDLLKLDNLTINTQYLGNVNLRSIQCSRVVFANEYQRPLICTRLDSFNFIACISHARLPIIDISNDINLVLGGLVYDTMFTAQGGIAVAVTDVGGEVKTANIPTHSISSVNVTGMLPHEIMRVMDRGNCEARTQSLSRIITKDLFI